VIGDSASIFENIYRETRWGAGLGSGHGSLPKGTERYRAFLEDFIRANRVARVVDYGCGDWQFSRLIDWHGVEYVGLDVVPALIEANRSAFARPGVSFELNPGHPEELPEGDLLIAKDVLQHLPTADIHAFLADVMPRYRLALLTNDTGEQVNGDVAPGGWRALDLTAEPFSVGTVIAVFRGPAVRTGRLRRQRFGRWTKHTVLVTR
jgi:SAM-dependent methyltransferase